MNSVLIVGYSESPSYDQIAKSASWLKEDYDIQFCHEDEIDSRLENADFIISHWDCFRRVKRKLKNYSCGVFLDDPSGFVKTSKNLITWVSADKVNQRAMGVIPVNFNENELVSKERLLKNIAFRIQDGLDLVEGRINRHARLLLPSVKFHTGRLSYSQKNFRIKGRLPVSVGSFCSFGDDVLIITENHDTRYTTTQGFFYNYHFDKSHPGSTEENISIEKSKGPVRILNDVWIGDRAIILSGVTIGNGACVAAGSIVTKDVEPYSIVAGAPAKQIKKRFSNEICSMMEREKWWDWSVAKIISNRNFFETDWSKDEVLNTIRIND